MSRSIEVLDQIAKSDTAVFAFDANDLVILWNKACEELLGRSAYQVLGRHCYDIMCGRDMYGNLYCCPTAPSRCRRASIRRTRSSASSSMSRPATAARAAWP